MLQERLVRWLSRPLEKSVVRTFSDPPCVLATDIGNVRPENQDRVAGIRVHPGQSHNRPFIALAVSDGMGGMKDGAACATLTLAAFFDGLVRNRRMPLHDRARIAAIHANEQVYKFSRGEGGATLSAALIDVDGLIVCNIGDSRVYAEIEAYGERTEVVRVTTDDSLEDAFGSEGKGLLQFIGMGSGVVPHILQVPDDTKSLILTSDGIHYIDQKLFSTIIINSANIKQAAERLSAIARWSGGPDNATIAAFRPSEVLKAISMNEDAALEVWSPSGSAHLMWVTAESPALSDMHKSSDRAFHEDARQPEPSLLSAIPVGRSIQSGKQQPAQEPSLLSPLTTELERKTKSSRNTKQKNKTAKKKKTGNQQKSKKRVEQLRIEIDGGDSDDDSGAV